MTITDDGDFVTTGLLLEDDKKYICSSGSLGGFFVFHPIVQGKSSSKDCSIIWLSNYQLHLTIQKLLPIRVSNKNY